MDDNELKITDLGRAGAAYAEQLLKEKIAELDAALARAEAAERRVAELEAAQEWRPVTEAPDKSDWRSGFLVATESEFVYYANEYNKGAWLWGDGWMHEIVGVTHWRHLPLPPTPSNSTGLEDSASPPQRSEQCCTFDLSQMIQDRLSGLPVIHFGKPDSIQTTGQ